MVCPQDRHHPKAAKTGHEPDTNRARNGHETDTDRTLTGHEPDTNRTRKEETGRNLHLSSLPPSSTFVQIKALRFSRFLRFPGLGLGSPPPPRGWKEGMTPVRGAPGPPRGTRRGGAEGDPALMSPSVR